MFSRASRFLVLAVMVGVGAQANDFRDVFTPLKTRLAGRAVTAIVDDYTSLYTNPAGLAQIEEWELRLPELLTARLSFDVFNVINAFQGLSTSGSTGIGAQLIAFDRKAVSIGADLIGIGYFQKGLGIMLNPLSLDFQTYLRTPSALFAKASTRITADGGLSAGYAHAFLDNKLRVGIAVRPFMVRLGFEADIQGSDLVNLGSSNALTVINQYKSNAGLGWGFDADIGVQGNLSPMFGVGLRPMFGISFNNMLATKFTNRLGSASNTFTGTPPALQRKLNIGVGASLDNLVSWFRPVFAIEVRDLIANSSDFFVNNVSYVVRMDWRLVSWFKGSSFVHWYRGNIGGGVAGKLWKGELTLGTWGENLGSRPGVGVSRIFAVQLAAAW